MPTGTIRNWHQDRGYGFIRRDGGGSSREADTFIHVSELERAGIGEPYEGKRVSFEVGVSQRTGKPQAENVQALSSQSP
jgi:cold shock protein